MDRIFLDANVLYSASYLTSSSFRRLWKLHGVRFVTSAYAVEEVTRNLKEDRPERLEELRKLLDAFEVVPDPVGLDLPRSVKLATKDHPIMVAAIHARATHLLTGDRTHFSRFYRKSVGGVLILTPAEYLATRE